MALYNPYNSQDDYYSPYENIQQPEGPGLGAALFDTAKKMAVFGVLNMVGRSVAKKASATTATYLSKGAGSPTTLGGILKNTGPGKLLSNAYSSATQPFREALQRKDAYVAMVAKNYGPSASKIAGFKSSFKDTRTFAGSVGRMWKNSVWAGAGVAYAIDSFAGNLEGYGIEKKQLYDIPGQVSNFAKWLAYDSVYSMGLSGALKFAKFSGAVGKTGVKNTFKGPLGDSAARVLANVAPDGAPAGFRGQSLHSTGNILKKNVYERPHSNVQQSFVSTCLRNAFAFGRTVSGGMRTMNETVHELGENFKTAVRTENGNLPRAVKKGVFDPVRAALANIKKIWHEERSAKSTKKTMSPVDHAGFSALEFVDELAAKLQQNALKRNPSRSESFAYVSKEFKKIGKAQRGKRTVVDDIFPEMDKVTNKDIVDQDWVQRTHGIISKAYGKKRTDEFMKSVLNMHAGLHIYKPKGASIRGGGVDLSFMDPLHTAKRLFGYALNRSIKVPFTNMQLNFSDMFQANLFLDDRPTFDFFRSRQDFEIGKNARGVNFKLDKGKVSSTGQLDDDAWFTAHINGKMAIIGPTGVKMVDTGKNIRAVAPSSSYKRAQQERLEQKLVERKPEPKPRLHSNKYVDFFLEKSKLSLPRSVQSLYSKARAVLDGKNHSYVQAGKNAFVDNPTDWYVHGDVIQALKEQTGQDLVSLFRNRNFLSNLADVTHASRFGDVYDVMTSARSLRTKLSDMESIALRKGEDWASWLNKRGIAEEVALIKASPQYAEGHIVSKRLGHRLEVNAYDKVRIALLEDSFAEGWATGDGKEHPLLQVIPRLVQKGALNDKQAQSLSLFAKLSAFNETGMFNRRNGVPGSDNLTNEIGRKMLARSHELNWNIQREIIDYAQSRELRVATTRKTGLTERGKFRNNTAYVSVGKSGPDIAYGYAENILNNVTNMLRDTVFPFRKDPSENLDIKGNLGYLFGGIAKIAAGGFALKALDAGIAANPLFNDTALQDGLGGFLADNVARVRLAQSKAFDILGVTGVAKHLNGLLPGFTTSAPGAILGAVVSRTMGGGFIGMAKGFGYGAIGNRLLAPYLPDFTKTYDQLEDEYQGKVEVPMMKSPTWLLGSTPFEGSKVIGYQPNWYVRMKSRWKETDTLYGSTMRKLIHEPLPLLGISIGDFVDPYYMERKHFFSRPYPETGEWGKEIPLVGPLIAGTVGRIFKPKKTMHQEFLTGPADLTEDSAYPFAIQPPTMAENAGRMYHTLGLRKQGGRSSLIGTYVYGGESKMWAQAAGEDFLENVQGFAGLPGFIAGTAREKLINSPLVMPTLETAGRMASQTRAFYDMNLGGMGVFTEPVRRLIDKPDYKRYGINPIPNLMPNWLPNDFLTGDPYAKIMKGELRLPGKAYQVTHKVKKTMPARSSMFGAQEEHMVQYFTGLLSPLLKEEYDILATGTTMHEKIQDHLAAEGLLIQAEALVYDVKNDISGHVDAIIRDGQGGKGRKALEIKSINQQAFNKLSGPKDQHVGQLNFYLKQLHLQEGTIMYVSRDNPSQVKTFNIRYSRTRFDKDLRKLQKSRQVAADMMKEGVDDQFGYSYSWLDRLGILADVAPTSSEFKEAKFFVEKQMKAGLLSESDIQRYSVVLSHRQARLRKYELYPNRFKGKVFSPDTEKNIQSINEDIKAAAEYTLPERIVGAVWERFTNSNTMLTNKLFAFKDPLEHYQMLKLYGKEYKPWDELYSSFAEPTFRGMAASTTPTGGALKFSVPAYMFLGPAAGLAGGILGAGYGTVHGLYRAATGTGYIPGIIQEQRDIEGYFDTAKYEKSKRMADLSDGLAKQEYLAAMNSTLTAFNQNGQDVANLFRATPYMEKPYIEPWLNVTNDKERKDILKYIPKELGIALKRQWNKNDAKDQTKEYDANSSADVAAGSPRMKFDRRLLDPSVQLEDIKLKTIEDAGFKAHDFGLGWNEQLYRLQGSIKDIAPINVSNVETYTPSGLNAGQVRQTIMTLCQGRNIKSSAQVYINEGANDLNSINITIRRDRSLTISRALGNREKYYG